MKERDQQQRLASETKNREDWIKFKMLRNKINNRLKYDQRSWQKDKLDEYDGNPSKNWKNVRDILNWQSSGSPNQLFYQGRLISKPQELADAQNQYFIDKINLLIENLPAAVLDPLLTLRSLMLGRSCCFSFSAVPPGKNPKLSLSIKKKIF